MQAKKASQAQAAELSAVRPDEAAVVAASTQPARQAEALPTAEKRAADSGNADLAPKAKKQRMAKEGASETQPEGNATKVKKHKRDPQLSNSTDPQLSTEFEAKVGSAACHDTANQNGLSQSSLAKIKWKKFALQVLAASSGGMKLSKLQKQLRLLAKVDKTLSAQADQIILDRLTGSSQFVVDGKTVKLAPGSES